MGSDESALVRPLADRRLQRNLPKGMASPPALRKKRMLCAKSPLPRQADCCLCEGGAIQQYQLADAVWLQLNQIPLSPSATSSAVYQ